jgi:hypothetical protein
MERMATLIVIFIFFQVAITQNSTANYTWGNNMVINPDFTLSIIPVDNIAKNYNTSMVGWSCDTNCECQNTSAMFKHLNRTLTNNISENVDLDSNAVFDNISQIISLRNSS